MKTMGYWDYEDCVERLRSAERSLKNDEDPYYALRDLHEILKKIVPLIPHKTGWDYDKQEEY